MRCVCTTIGYIFDGDANELSEGWYGVNHFALEWWSLSIQNDGNNFTAHTRKFLIKAVTMNGHSSTTSKSHDSLVYFYWHVSSFVVVAITFWLTRTWINHFENTTALQRTYISWLNSKILWYSGVEMAESVYMLGGKIDLPALNIRRMLWTNNASSWFISPSSNQPPHYMHDSCSLLCHSTYLSIMMMV